MSITNLQHSFTRGFSWLDADNNKVAGATRFGLVMLILTTLMVLAGLTGCGTNGGYPGGGISALSKSSATIDSGQSFSVAATVSGGSTPTWSLAGPTCTGASCGTLSSTSGSAATYTAPEGVTTQLQVTLTAAIAGTQNKQVVAITVNPDPLLSGNVSPGTVGVAYSSTITVSGGTAPLTAMSVVGTLPPGLTFNASTGHISGTPTTVGTYTFKLSVTDSSDIPLQITASETIVVSAPIPALVVLGGTPPAGTVGSAYAYMLNATGGTTPYTWSITSGSLPAGLVLNATTGVISGIPTAAGLSVFTAQAQDATGAKATAVFSITVNAASTPLTLTVSTLPNGTVGVAYAATIGVTGGTAPYSCVFTSGTLPAGLTLTGCTVSGIPTQAGTSTLTVRATDSSNPTETVSGPISITIGTATLPLTLTVSTLPNGTVGVAYTATIGVSGGTAPYTCVFTAGTLPAGLTLTGCVVSGIPTTAGTSALTVKVTDSSNPTQTTSGPISITINPAPVLIIGTPLSGVVGVPYIGFIPVSGGIGPYSCVLTSGSLPAGLTLTPAACAITGTPTTIGATTFTIKATDSSNPAIVTTGPVTFTVNPSLLLLTLAPLPNGTVGVPYTATIGVTGGTSPYTCAFTTGTLPAGLTISGCTISGTPTAAGTAILTVKVTDSGTPPQTAVGPITIVINPAPTLTIGNVFPNPVAGVPYIGVIPVTGGIGPYTCTLTGGTLPAGLTLTPALCAITGTPTAPGTTTITVKVTDSSNPVITTTGTSTITVSPGLLVLSILPLPVGTVGVPYTATIGVTGGTSPYTCAFTVGTLPAGLTISGCTITGTPTTAGTSILTVKVTDSGNPAQTAIGPVTIIINPAVTLTIGNVFPNPVAGVPYIGVIPVTGGIGPYTCTLVGGTLPAGLTLTPAACAITGTATTPGTTTLTVKVTDSSSPAITTTGNSTITVAPSLLLLTLAPLPTGTVGVPYTATIGVTGGTSPYNCAFTLGTLPAGLTITGCTISGTPTASGTTILTVQVTDSGTPAQTAIGPVTIVINPAPKLTIGNVTPDPIAGTPYTGVIPVTGGTGPYTCTLASGSTLPAGLTLGPNCTITGTATTPGTTPVTVVVTDSGQPPITTTGTITITVDSSGTLTLTGTAPNAIVNEPYTTTLTATGGTTPYTSYTITAGSLPAGLTLNSTTGVISGTPTAVGASSFTATVTDSENPAKTASLSLVLLVTYPLGPNDGLLKGPYAFLFQGYDDVVAGVLAYKTASVGSFIADGAGLVTNGELDENHEYSNPTGNTIATEDYLGTYTVGTDDRGFITITTLHADGTTAVTRTYAIALKAPATQAAISTSGSLIEYDNLAIGLASKGSGTLLAQTPAAFANGLTGNYAFGMSGDTPCLPTCTIGVVAGPVAAVGEFTGTAGAVSGTGDSNVGATTYTVEQLSGAFGAADANGRLQLSMTTLNTPTGVYPTDYAVYVVDANNVFLMSTDKHSAYLLLAGSAQARTQTAFTNASLTGPFIGYENSASNPGLVSATLSNLLNVSTATIFRTTATGDDNCNTTNVTVGGLTALTSTLTGLGGSLTGLDNLLGTLSTTGTATCAVSNYGRATLQYPQEYLLGIVPFGVPPAPRVIYLSAPDRGYFLESSYAGLGNIEPQTGSPYSLATFDGTFVYGGVPASSLVSINSSGTLTADGKGNVTSTVDENIGVGTLNILELGVSGPTTYTTPDVTSGVFSYGTFVVYTISPGRFVMVDTNPLTTSPSVTLLY